MTAVLAGVFCASAALLPALAADSVQSNTANPQLMLPATEGWSGFIARASDPGIYLPIIFTAAQALNGHYLSAYRQMM